MIVAIAKLLGINRLIVTAGLIGLAAAGVWGVYAYVKHQGAEEVRTELREKNNEAGIAGSEARMSRADCHRRGGMYDFRTGKCSGLETGGR